MTLVQVALDLTSVEEALEVARSCVEAGVHVLEAGTPLIKAEGERAVEVLSREFPERMVVADTKTMDVGELEARMVLEAGGDVGCVLGAAPEETISAFVKEMHKEAAGALVDTIGCDPSDVLEKINGIEETPDYLLLHAAIDEPIHGGELLEDTDVDDDADVGLAVAGGLNPERIEDIDGVDLVVVGGYITGAEDPREAAEEVLKAAGSEPYTYRPTGPEAEFLREFRLGKVVALVGGDDPLEPALNLVRWRRPGAEIARVEDPEEVPERGDVLVVEGADAWSGDELNRVTSRFPKVVLLADDNVLKLHGVADAVVEL